MKICKRFLGTSNTVAGVAVQEIWGEGAGEGGKK